MNSNQLDEFRQRNSRVFFVDMHDRPSLQDYLCRRDLIAEGESITALELAGQGNMNCTLRVRTPHRSLIVKQSRPWVEKFPEIAAPWERVLSEARFYMLVSPETVVFDRMPNLLHLDAESRIMVLEDLGPARDFTGCYNGEPLDCATAVALAGWLSELHAIEFQSRTRESLRNLEMRRLNHAHLFHLPLDHNNGFRLDEITPGLSTAAERLQRDRPYVECVRELGELYLADGRTLLHGDFFPGSWLQGEMGPRVIDPEFAFFGDPEFDLGVFLAHLYLARQPEQVHEACLTAYRRTGRFHLRLALRFSGVEIMRRLIGIAQLPLDLELSEKERLLELSRDLVRSADVLASSHVAAKTTLARLLELDDDADVRCA